MSDYDDLVAALAPVSSALRKLGIRHYVSGSVASSFHGATRSTMDVDVVADLEYLKQSAESIGVQDLLKELLSNVGLGE